MKQKINVIFAGLATAGSMILSAPAFAQQSARNCAPRNTVIDRLAEGYGETRQSMGLGANNSVVETFASNETGTWTITVTTPTGLTCLVASGQSFEKLNENLPVKEQDASYKRTLQPL